ncbi:MAG: PKD domain-containing protein [Bacteroidota bacterium]
MSAFATPDTDGCIPVTLSFVNQSVGADFFSWNFGDGNTSTEVNPDHTYSEPGTYIVTLVATDINGCFTDSSVVNIQAYPLPDVGFTFEIEEDCGLPATVNFTNQSLGADGFEWRFGNGETSQLNNPVVVYEMAGEYTVTLVGETAFGCVDSMEAFIPFFDAPLASFSMPFQEGCAPVIVPFNSDALFADAVVWDFGDGTTSEEFNPVHVYTEPGIYDVSLTATFQGDCSDTFVLTNLVRVSESPNAAFSFEELVDPVESGIFQFTNMSQGATDFQWDFGDGETSNAVSPSHRYFENAEYLVELIATANNGCADTATAVISPEGLAGLFIPNAFSPEAGRGDVTLFKPAGVGLREYRIEVYSPWGKLLWSSEALENGQPAEAWDGTYNGVLLPQDVYVWKAFAIFDDGSPWAGMPDRQGRTHRVGSLTLLR